MKKIGDNVGTFTLLNQRGSEAGEKLLVQRRLHVHQIWHLGLCVDGESNTDGSSS